MAVSRSQPNRPFAGVWFGAAALLEATLVVLLFRLIRSGANVNTFVVAFGPLLTGFVAFFTVARLFLTRASTTKSQAGLAAMFTFWVWWLSLFLAVNT